MVLRNNRHSRKLRSWFLLATMLVSTHYCFSQEKTKTIPDGTEGDVMVLKDSADKKCKKQWNTINLGFTTMTFGIGMLFDYNAFSQDKNGQIQTDSLKDDLKSSFEVRDFRILSVVN
jgi:translation elongation factor EF-1beta